ncbi:predicted protein [Sparassis crispa]|uniref:HMG box domain-containing protein n=1 Tax=Sparassis crispa TaxID=139825 RepID=A0A401GKU2_9APHY|nr:predicted protein [Sparassis crispa]GBE82791.1 predicted protein [Sparassis crispa]
MQLHLAIPQRRPHSSDAPRRPTVYTSASSERRALRNLERDPSWVPRPPNAFIIFRAEYSKNYAQTHEDGESPPTSEKSLSKRAAEAWGELTTEEKAPYKWRAEQERLEHGKKYPDYKYRPRRRQKGASDGGTISRREVVESFMRRAASGSQRDSESDLSGDCPSPPSMNSSSPEPVDTPLGSDSPSDTKSFDFSSILPPAEDMTLYPFFLLPSSSASAPCLTLSSSMDSSPWSSADLGFSPYAGVGATGSRDRYSDTGGNGMTPAMCESVPGLTPSETALLDQLSLDMSTSLSPEYAATSMFAGPSSYPLKPTQLPQESDPLYHRRQRSATVSSLPSPLTVVTSTLADWDGPTVPTITVEQNSTPFFPSPQTSMSTSSLLAAENAAPWDLKQDQEQIPTASLSDLRISVPDIDLDRTPRGADFPQHVQGEYVPPSYGSSNASAYPATQTQETLFVEGSSTASNGVYSGVNTNPQLAAYTMGLTDHGIEPMTYCTSPFADLEFPYVTPGLFP